MTGPALVPTEREAVRAPPRIAIAGNPNTGKTSLFNRLTGATARVGNYPGVTVEREEARWRLAGREVEVLDVPGTYSLAARSAEEQVAVRALFGLDGHPRPHLVLVVVDATQLVRNLYLALQIAEAQIPMVIALNLADVARAQGVLPEAQRVGAAFGVPCVAVSAHTGEGLAELAHVVDEALDRLQRPSVKLEYAPPLEADLARLMPFAEATTDGERRALALWSLLSVEEHDELLDVPAAVRREVTGIRRGAQAAGRDLDGEIVGARYRWLEAHDFGVGRPAPTVSWTERVDRFLLHPLSGGLSFLVVMGVLFQALFAWSDPFIAAIEGGFAWIADVVRATFPAGVLTDLLVDGVINGVGGVVVFLPQILLLFFLLGFLEDSGYMARVAFLVDRAMKALGLHGRAFVPMLSGYACAVPAIMATRTLERRRDRLLTMMVVPLMSCSARLPVYTLVIATVFPMEARWLGLPVPVVAMLAMYLLSTGMALAAAGVLGRTLLRGPKIPLLLELPPYRMPRLATVLTQMWLRAKSFLTEAGTTILVVTVILWGLLYFPRATPEDAVSNDPAVQLEQSYAGRLGKLIEPAIAPLGMDWKMGVGVVGAFAAREVFVSTMGVIYGIGDDADETSEPLRDRMRAEVRPDGTPTWTPLVGASLMVFFAFSAQCLATLAVVRRESHSWKWPIFLFAYMTALAWVAGFAVFQGGKLLGWG